MLCSSLCIDTGEIFFYSLCFECRFTLLACQSGTITSNHFAGTLAVFLDSFWLIEFVASWTSKSTLAPSRGREVLVSHVGIILENFLL